VGRRDRNILITTINYTKRYYGGNVVDYGDINAMNRRDLQISLWFTLSILADTKIY